MWTGIVSGILWAAETVLLGAALSRNDLQTAAASAVLVSVVCTFIHDFGSSVCITLYNLFHGGFEGMGRLIRSRDGMIIAVASIIGGPLGMTGYVIAVNNLGAAVGAIATAIYPAIGTVLAHIFLKERMKWYQWIFLILCLAGVYGLSYSPEITIRNFWLGVTGAVLCSVGWGLLAVIMAACLRNPEIRNESALQIKHCISALVLGGIAIPYLHGWGYTIDLIRGEKNVTLLLIAAGCMATASYLYAYRSIRQVGASKFMALNITYTAWALLITALLPGGRESITPLTVLCAVDVMICGVGAATDVKELSSR